MKKKNFKFMAACIGDCCDDPHIVEINIKAVNLDDAFTRARTKLVKKHYDVGDLFVVEAFAKPYKEHIRKPHDILRWQ